MPNATEIRSDPVLFGFYRALRDDELRTIFLEFCAKYPFYAEVFQPNPRDSVEFFSAHYLMKTIAFARFPSVYAEKSIWFFETGDARLRFLAILNGMEAHITW